MQLLLIFVCLCISSLLLVESYHSNGVLRKNTLFPTTNKESNQCASIRSFTTIYSNANPNDNTRLLDDRTRERIDNYVKNNKIVLFMKGNKLFPQCGFSNTAVRILDAIGKPFETVNVLEDEQIRQGIKIYSSWPTIPQLYGMLL